MRLKQALQIKVGWMMLCVGALCLLLGLPALLYVLSTSILNASIGFAEFTIHSVEGDGCRANPETWHLTTPEGAEMRAADLKEVRALGVAPDYLDEVLVARILEGNARAWKPILGNSTWRGAVLMTFPDNGACSLVQLKWPKNVTHRKEVTNLLGGLTLFFMVAVALGIGRFIVQPMTRRIAALDIAAAGLGDEKRYASAGDSGVDELGELSRALDRAHERIHSGAIALEEKSLAMQRHLSDVSHDLKTPLTALQITVEQMDAHPLSGEMSDLIQRAVNDIVYLTGLTNNLRLSAQLQEGVSPIHGAPVVDLGQIVDQVAGRMSPLLRRAGLGLTRSRPDEPLRVCCNPVMLQQMVVNLIQNVISHAEGAQHVALILEASEAGGFVLRVLDDGPGVPPHALGQLKRRFYQSQTDSKDRQQGLGLGLAIVNAVCDGCGWQLVFESLEPSGLSVTIMGDRIEAN